MTTLHEIIVGAAQNLSPIKDSSVDLIVTSPPYPMIEMWDEIMAKQNTEIADALADGNGARAFELMHLELDKVWSEVNRVLKPGCFACINIGDATRTINEEFALYSNHSRIITAFNKLGMTNLPNIIWRKQTNAPNKFMGSGMLPAGAYVTLEHEWILIFRKGGKRVLKTPEERERRRESAFFWEERNVWFSDLWDLKGVKQSMSDSETRKRSAAYPFEIPYRLINMYSLKNDVVVDPFLGTGTTILAAIASERNSIGVEIDKSFAEVVKGNILECSVEAINIYIQNRIKSHQEFIVKRVNDIDKSEVKHFNKNLNLPVITSQETGMQLSYLENINMIDDLNFTASYKIVPEWNFKIEFPLKKSKVAVEQGVIGY